MATGVISDPIADLLTRIRNGLIARHVEVRIPHSRVKARIAEILVQEGYVQDVEIVPAGIQSEIRVKLKYTPSRDPVIKGLRRISKPGLRVYKGRLELPRVQGGLGIAVLSTSKGVMTDREARRQKVGGEVLCEVW
ncbi:MAG TPA: 30S ribosomal protein S8 [Actinomycetota bacterium]|jgi:small subunit ribosomal protein S8|nr:30S ribosomal protein S8 [Actinomycetota bacterium]